MQVQEKDIQLGTARNMQNESLGQETLVLGTGEEGQQSMGRLCWLLLRPRVLNSAGLVQYADGERQILVFD